MTDIIVLPKRELALPRGHWHVQKWESKEHELSGDKPLWEEEFDNGITDAGIHFVLDRFTNVGTPSALSWYGGLINNSGFTGLAAADTAASHSGWTELTDYSESVRQTLNFSAAASRAISDSISFSINATVAVNGLFVISDNTKSGTSGTLFSTASFSSVQNFVNGNTATANYTLSD